MYLSMTTTSVDFTVAIPTFNGAERIPKVLKALKSQINTHGFTWEVLVVDNNSSDQTKEVVDTQQSNWPDTCPLSYVFEPKQGLAFARQCAVETARGAFVGFLDDDTIPNQDWIEAAYRFGINYPHAGAFGGQVHGDFESSPPENFERIQSFLAIKEHGPNPKLFNPENLFLPAGAGLVIRKQAWIDSVPKKLARVARGGNDFEISIHLHKAGWEIWYNPDMHVVHEIPSWRLEPEYLLKISKTVGLCVCELRIINSSKWKRPVVFFRVLLGNFKRMIMHWFKYRGQLSRDIVVSCEMAFFTSGFLSPFEFLKKKLKPNLQ